MDGFRPADYGDRMASIYDAWIGHFVGPDEAERAAGFLAALAGDGRALELGLGTGRIALPLAARGVEVHGIDISPAMVEQLREKPGGDAVRAVVGDMADVAVDGPFRLVYAALSSFLCLTSQDEQVRCLANAARVLEPGGVVVVEALIPDLAPFRGDGTLFPARVEKDWIGLEAIRLDRAAQTWSIQEVVISEGGIRLYPVVIRYVWPAELDLMARLAGLRLRERTEDWSGRPYSGGSRWHVSVYERA